MGHILEKSKFYLYPILIAVVLLLQSSPAIATPITWGDSVVKPPAWPKNSTINVYIQADPKGQGRDQLIKEGVERWKQTLTDRMITVNVTIGNPPADAVNPVTYTWQADGFKSGDKELGAGKNDGIGTASSDGESINGGEAFIRNELPSGTDDEKNYLKNLGEHELTHVLGLADDDNGAVTKHEQPTGARALNDQDKKEVNTLYGTANTGGSGKPQGTATQIGGSATLGFYQYRFDFVPGNLIEDPNDPEHIALITFDINPILISGITLPDGWIAFSGPYPPTSDNPFFTEGYMLDGFGSIPPWDPLDPMSFIALRTSVQEAQNDGLPAGYDPGLSTFNSFFDVFFEITPNIPVEDGEIEVWAGGSLQRVAGPKVIPEPLSLVLLASGLTGMAIRRRKR